MKQLTATYRRSADKTLTRIRSASEDIKEDLLDSDKDIKKPLMMAMQWLYFRATKRVTGTGATVRRHEMLKTHCRESEPFGEMKEFVQKRFGEVLNEQISLINKHVHTASAKLEIQLNGLAKQADIVNPDLDKLKEDIMEFVKRAEPVIHKELPLLYDLAQQPKDGEPQTKRVKTE